MDCPGEFGHFVDHVPARGLLEAIKHRAEKEAARLKAQTAQAGLP